MEGLVPRINEWGILIPEVRSNCLFWICIYFYWQLAFLWPLLHQKCLHGLDVSCKFHLFCPHFQNEHITINFPSIYVGLIRLFSWQSSMIRRCPYGGALVCCHICEKKAVTCLFVVVWSGSCFLCLLYLIIFLRMPLDIPPARWG